MTSYVRVRGWLACAIAAAVAFFLPLPAWAIEEFYARDAYPFVQLVLTRISNVVPFALLDVLLLTAAAGLVARLVALVHVAWRQSALAALWEGIRRLTRLVGVTVLVFVTAWGCNYRREPLETALAGGVAIRPTVQLLEETIESASAVAARLRPAAHQSAGLSYDELAELLREPMNRALATLNREPLSTPGRPKTSIILTPFFTRAGVNGMIDPLLLESIVHPGLTPAERPFVLAHEWAHLAGQADEAEANAVGWLACMFGSPVTAYSGTLYLIMDAAGALPAAARRQALAGLDPGVRADINAIARRVTLEDPRVQEAASRVYDQYLRANRVADGTASYERGLTLVLSPPIRDALDAYRARDAR